MTARSGGRPLEPALEQVRPPGHSMEVADADELHEPQILQAQVIDTTTGEIVEVPV